MSMNSCTLAQSSLSELLKKNIEGIILDLRGNQGGLVPAASCIAGLFLKEGTKTIRLEFFPGQNTQLSTEYKVEHDSSKPKWEGPLSILVDANTASAAEALAGVLRASNSQSILIGDRTFGKGIVQSVVTYAPKEVTHYDVFYMKTIAEYFPIHSGRIQRIGLTPDIPDVAPGSAVPMREEKLLPVSTLYAPIQNEKVADISQEMKACLAKHDDFRRTYNPANLDSLNSDLAAITALDTMICSNL